MTAYSETITTVGALAANDRVRAVASKTGFVRVYDPGLGTSTRNATNLPLVAVVTAALQHDDAAPWYTEGVTPGAGQKGAVRIQLTVAAADTGDASSVQTFTVESGALAIKSVGND